ncbi:MAG: FAD-dependent oxidoreductase [Deltaproteobacteria bacterium]|nr:FAD-dependent oxidoreductase [Deltaproteobacteria bacterium]MBW2387325.1 FAD-dependent oxidoreductase [Deltaproteobacteria bacterium]
MKTNPLAYLDLSPWLPAQPESGGGLDGDLDVDVLIVGGGLTGLSTALSLRAEGASVAILERDTIGAGASGRNAGHLTPTIGKDLPTLLRMFGRDRARALVRLADDAVGYAEQLIEKHSIECEYEANGNILAGLHPKHEQSLRAAAAAALALGGEVDFLDRGAMRERGLPAAFTSGALERRGGILHPGLYVAGLRRAAQDMGVRIFEGVQIERLIDGQRPVAECEGGRVTASSAVLATNAYTTSFGWMPRRVVPLRVSLFETEPLEPDELQALGWSGREGIYTAHEMLESYRLTARGSIVGGSKIVRYAYGSGLAEGYDEAAFRFIEAAFRSRFPTLADRPIAHFWGGWIGLTLDFLPRIGSTQPTGRVFHGIGYAGHGVAQASLMGALLADRIAGREHPCEAALRRRAFDWPPEPLRAAAARAVVGALSYLDRRTDRQIQRLGSAVGSGEG